MKYDSQKHHCRSIRLKGLDLCKIILTFRYIKKDLLKIEFFKVMIQITGQFYSKKRLF